MDQDTRRVRIRFGEHEFDGETLELRRQGRLVDLAPMPARVLAVLVRHPDTLVTREELYRELWPDGGVDVDRALNTHIRQVRQALGERSGENRFIRTHPGRGYRFVAETGNTDRSTEGPPGPRGSWAATGAWTVGGVLAAVILVSALSGPARPPDAALRPLSPASLTPDQRIDYLTGLEFLGHPLPDRRAEAIPHLRSVATARPDFAPAHGALAEALTWAGEAPAAVPVARAALALEPGDPRALRALGTALLVSEWAWEEAETLLRRAVTAAPDDAESHVALAYLLISAGRGDDARASLLRAADLEPTSPVVTGDIGMLYGWIGEHRRALDLCRRTVRIEPRATWGHACVRRAERALGLAAEDAPADPAASSPGTHLGRAVALARRGETHQAIEELARSAQARETGFVAMAAIPDLRRLHGEARFEALRARLFRQ